MYYTDDDGIWMECFPSFISGCDFRKNLGWNATLEVVIAAHKEHAEREIEVTGA